MSKPRSRTFLVTGASKGIGHATAMLMGSRGHRVIGLARTNPEGDFPGPFVTIDLQDRHETSAVLAQLADDHEIDGVVNNVGLVNPQKLDEIDLPSFEAVIDLNLRTAIQTVQAALPHMKSNGWGRIVNISSLVAVGVPWRTSYAAAKTALISFTRSWALELAEAGITVNAVAPGPIATELFNTNNPPGSASRDRYISGIPMKRTGTPEEVAAAIGFLLSDEASFVTGQTLFVDGGSSIGRSLV